MIILKERIGKLIQDLQKLIYSRHFPITEYRVCKGNLKFLNINNIDTSDWETLKQDVDWGGGKERLYFETVLKLPDDCEGDTLVYELRTGKEGDWDALNPQFLAYVNGEIKQGLDANHREIHLTDSAKRGEIFRIMLEAYSGDRNPYFHMDSELKVLDSDVQKYYYDVSVPYNVARLLPQDSMDFIDIIQCLNESLNLLDLRRPYSEEFYESLAKAQNYITKEFYEKRCGNSRAVISCVGHTHIDCAWLWTLDVTRGKVVRSFSTVLELMKRYPEYKFMSSQPQLYQYVKEDAPEIYKQIKEKVKEGRWEVEGATWVEMDCNLPSGESLVRQFIYGKRFFRDEFGKNSEILWLPDVFGYSAALPQIMQKCGIHYFMTTKINWNEFNKMPYDTFMWEGIDGTQVLTHFSPTRDYGTSALEGRTEYFTTYNGILNPSMVKGNWDRYSQKELHTNTLMCYGYGDGGGGPTEEMLENGRRLEKGIPGCPRTMQSHTQEFFHKLEKDVEGNRFLPKWVGELYLEYHRGTYTSMAQNKKFNRKSEFAYENLEFYSVMAGWLLKKGYPKKMIQDSWEVILRNQFHDILPGSSIQKVYEDSKIEYEKILKQAADATKVTLQEMADNVKGKAGELVIFNPNGTTAKAPVVIEDFDDEVGEFPVLDDGGKQFLLQKTEDGYIAVIDSPPQKGYRKYKIKGSDIVPQRDKMIRSCGEIETPFFYVTLNENGQFDRIYDKQNQREVIPPGKIANRIVTYEDIPHNYDAWDINNYYTEKCWPIDSVTKIQILENGPVRACIRVERTYLASVIVQFLYFYRDLARIDICNEIDWKESQILVRDYFPVNVHTDEAVFEIQYGNIKRSTNNNTMWEFAKFEVCSHKWLDVSERGYGVGILNDCKYGCSVKDGIIGLTMLKSSVYPNPKADKGHHIFWYSICPHKGDFAEAGIVADAYLFNNPLVAVKKNEIGYLLPEKFSFVTVQESHVVCEVVKQAEETEDIVLRIYETENRRGKIHIIVNGNFSRAWESDMLENPLKLLDFDGTLIIADILPFEIKTIILR